MNPLALLALIGVLTVTPGLAGGRKPGCGTNRPACPLEEVAGEDGVEALTATEKADLVYLREEEKLARDVYRALHARWKIRAFSNIAGSEQRHMDAVAALLDRYGVADAVGKKAPGVFNDSGLQALYTKLVAKGRRSQVDALSVGAGIEDLDIADLRENRSHTAKEDLLAVYANLERGSRNHMRAFTRLLRGLGESYTPAHLSVEEYREIIDAPHERGHGGGRGDGRGRGRGRGWRGGRGR